MGVTRGGIELVFGSRISDVTECGAEDLRLTDPIDQYFLRVLFHDHPPAAARAFVLQLLLRLEMAIMEYSEGRSSLCEFIANPIANTLHYFHSVHHFTASIGQAWQFFDLNRSKYKLRTGNRINIFKPKEDSTLEKLNTLYNESKHATADYESVHQPVWITNTGIASEPAELSFRELKEILEKTAAWCVNFLDPDYQLKRSGPIRN